MSPCCRRPLDQTRVGWSIKHGDTGYCWYVLVPGFLCLSHGGMEHSRQGMVRSPDLSYVKVCQISCRNLVGWRAYFEHWLTLESQILLYFNICYWRCACYTVACGISFLIHPHIYSFVLGVFATWSFKSPSKPQPHSPCCTAGWINYSIFKMRARLDHVQWRKERVWKGHHVVGAGDESNIHLSICLCIYCSQMELFMWHMFGTNTIVEGTLSWWYVCHSESNLSYFLYSRCHHNHHLILLL